MIRFRCTACGHQLKVAPSAAGKRGKCPRCGAVVHVPALPAPREVQAKPQEEKKVSFAALLPARKQHDHEEWIDMTSMVDIVFFLLIFFMVTSLNSQQASIEMPVPESRQASAGATVGRRTVADFEADDEYIIVRIDADDTIWVEDAEAPTPTDVVEKLRTAVHAARGQKQAPSRLLVLANGDAHHGTAVLVLDAGHEVGMQDMRLAIEDET